MSMCTHTQVRQPSPGIVLVLSFSRRLQRGFEQLRVGPGSHAQRVPHFPLPPRANGLDYMEFRLWIGLHSAIQCLILVATDASFIIKYITRFTEEGFSTLISFIFIYDAIKKMIGAFKYYPINMNFKPDSITTYKCECVAPDTGDR